MFHVEKSTGSKSMGV